LPAGKPEEGALQNMATHDLNIHAGNLMIMGFLYAGISFIMTHPYNMLHDDSTHPKRR
jgi:hypothetical protein